MKPILLNGNLRYDYTYLQLLEEANRRNIKDAENLSIEELELELELKEEVVSPNYIIVRKGQYSLDYYKSFAKLRGDDNLINVIKYDKNTLILQYEELAILWDIENEEEVGFATFSDSDIQPLLIPYKNKVFLTNLNTDNPFSGFDNFIVDYSSKLLIKNTSPFIDIDEKDERILIHDSDSNALFVFDLSDYNHIKTIKIDLEAIYNKANILFALLIGNEIFIAESEGTFVYDLNTKKFKKMDDFFLYKFLYFDRIKNIIYTINNDGVVFLRKIISPYKYKILNKFLPHSSQGVYIEDEHKAYMTMMDNNRACFRHSDVSFIYNMKNERLETITDTDGKDWIISYMKGETINNINKSFREYISNNIRSIIINFLSI